jgi:hypothetical protein
MQNLSQSSVQYVGAGAIGDRSDIQWALFLPLALLTAFLFLLGIMTGWHARAQDDRALVYAAFGNMGLPMAFSSSECRRPFGSASAGRLRHSDVLALLAKD